MTFSATINAGAFAKACNLAARVSPRATQASAPIVANLMLSSAGDAALKVQGTALDRFIAFDIEGKTQGAITASAERLAAVTKTLDPAGDVNMSVASNMLVLKQGRAVFKLQTLPPEHFGDAPAHNRPVEFKCATASLLYGLRAVQGATDDDDGRPYLNGVCFDATGKTPFLVATDGKVLAQFPLDFIENGKPPQIIIPQAALSAILSVAEMAETATLSVGAGSFTIEAAGCRFWTKVIDQTFPEWKRLIRKGSSTNCTVSVSDIQRSIARITAAGLFGVRIECGEVVKVSGASGRGDSPNGMDDEFAAVEIFGDARKTTLDARQFKWAVDSFPHAKTLDLALNDDASPVEVRDPKGDNDDVRVLVPWRSAK